MKVLKTGLICVKAKLLDLCVCALLCCFTWGKSEAVFPLSRLRHWQWPRAGGKNVQTLSTVCVIYKLHGHSDPR